MERQVWSVVYETPLLLTAYTSKHFDIDMNKLLIIRYWHRKHSWYLWYISEQFCITVDCFLNSHKWRKYAEHMETKK